MLYRLYQPSDFAQLYAIEELCFQPPLRFSRAYIRQLTKSPDAATWVAEEDNQLAGFTIAEFSAAAGVPLSYIQTIEVAPNFRKRGIACELLRRIEHSARETGARTIWLHVAEDNATAIHLYESHGFLLQGRAEDYYASGVPALIYAKSLE
jgi:ribosomal-protein-alanine N-acetyltransferase